MNSVLADIVATPSVSAHPRQHKWWQKSIGIANSIENGVLTVALALMVLLPLAEAGLRKLTQTSISGANAFEQHLTLILGMTGGAIAARQARLLSLSTLDTLLKGTWRTAARVISNSVAAAVTAFLTVASYQFFISEKEAAKVIAYGIPVWLIQVVLPAGFALIALRIIWHSSERWVPRVMTLAMAILFVLVALWLPVPRTQMLLPALGILLIATILGAPIFSVLGGAAILQFWAADVPIAALSVDHYRLVTNPMLPMVPLFTLVGFFLAEGRASQRLIRLFQALVGHFRGGPAILAALLCAFFTSFTGASGVTILALGGLLMPVLLAARYSERNALGLLTGTGSLGLLFPPCLPLIFYAVIAQVSIEKIFLAGLLPGVLLVVMTAIWGIRAAPRDAALGRKFSWTEARSALWEAKWEVSLPLVAFVGMFSGLATPVEAAALTALYAFVCEAFIHRDLRLTSDAPRAIVQCGMLVGGVLLILGVALGFTNYLVDAEIPGRAADWVTATVHSRWMFLLLLNLFLIVVGALMDIYSAIVIVVPLIVPIGVAFGIDPIHLGIIFLANAELGFLMPPVGENLFLSSYRFNKPVTEVFRSVIPMVLVFLIGVLLITYVPALTTTLPRWLSR